MAEHTGIEPVKLEEYMHPSDSETFWFSWTEKLAGETIASSTFIIPDSFTQVSVVENGSVTENGVVYSDANAITISTTNTKGTYAITNQIVTSAGRELNRSILVTVDSCI